MPPKKGSVNSAAAIDGIAPRWGTAHLSHQPRPVRATGLAGDAVLSCALPMRCSSLRTSGNSSSTCNSSNWKLSSEEAGAAAWGSRSTTAGRERRSWSKRSSSSSRYAGLGREGSVLAAQSAKGDVDSLTPWSGQWRPGGCLLRS